MADAARERPATERFVDHVGPAAAERPPPRLASAVGAFAALMGGVAVVSLAAEAVSGGAPRAVGALAGLVYGGGGLALLLWGLPSQRSAGVVSIAVAVPAVYGFLVLSGEFDRTDPTTVLALATITWGTLYVIGPSRGHPLLLAATLVGAWATVVVQVGLDDLFLSFEDPFDASPVFEPDTSGLAVASLLFGCGYLAAGYALDRAGVPGAATGFLGAGLAALGIGVFAAGTGRDPWLVGLLLVASGSLVGFVGGHLGRRLSTWLGAGVAILGLLSLVDATVPDDEVTLSAFVGVTIATVVVGAVPLLARGMGESDGYRESDISHPSPQPE